MAHFSWRMGSYPHRTKPNVRSKTKRSHLQRTATDSADRGTQQPRLDVAQEEQTWNEVEEDSEWSPSQDPSPGKEPQLSIEEVPYEVRPDTDIDTDVELGPHLGSIQISKSHLQSPNAGTDALRVFRSPPPADDAINREVHFRTGLVLGSVDVIYEMYNIQHPFLEALSSPQDVFFTHAAIAAVWSHMEDAAIIDPISRYLTQQRAPTLRKARANLKRADALSNNELLIQILLLAVIERLAGNVTATNRHLQILMLLIKARGGLKSLPSGSTVQILMMRVESVIALMSGKSIAGPQRRPFLAHYPGDSFAPDFKRKIDALPAGFRTLISESRLSHDTIELLVRAVNAGITKPAKAQRLGCITKQSSNRVYHDPIDACPILGIPDTPEIVLEKMICWTFFSCCYLEQISLRTSYKLYSSARQYLHDQILTYQAKSQAEFECVIWLWLIAIDAWREGSMGDKLLPEGFFLLQTFSKRFPLLATRWDAIEITVRLFFYNESFLAFWRNHWEDWMLVAQTASPTSELRVQDEAVVARTLNSDHGLEQQPP